MLRAGEDCAYRVDNDVQMKVIFHAVESILMEPEKQFSIKQLSREMGTNTNKLKTDFKKYFDLPVFGFVNRARMELARQMLSETNTPIREISQSVGYFYPQNFTKAFKKETGMAPKEFRKLSA